MKNLLSLLAIMALSGCGSLSEKETEIPVDQVPPAILDAAVTAVPGFEISGAEIEEEDGARVYELSGDAGGKSFEIEVSEDGEVLEVEEE